MVELTRRDGEVFLLDTFRPELPFVEPHLVSGASGEQWLILVYYADRSEYFVVVYSLQSPRKLFTGRSVDVEVGDLDQDGAPELVLFVPSVPIDYPEVGWPMVYKLKGHVHAEPLAKYPSVIGMFIEQAEQRIADFSVTCEALRETSGESKCPYERDLLFLTNELETAIALLSADR